MGACGIIFLSIFDTWNHNSIHDAMLVLFILGLNYPEHRILKISFILKAVFIVVEFTLAVAFASESRNGNRDVAGVLEWTVSFIYGLYVFSYVVDLLPSVRFKSHIPQGQRVREEMREAFAGDTNREEGGTVAPSHALRDSQYSDRSQYEMADHTQRNPQVSPHGPVSPTFPTEVHAQQA
ncbi:hypothetical protein KEM54_002348 [Ascosphaera aggregata]|nr:hypothetical protein KEM54_002348 [Ascosphaera aggregata]